MDSAFCVLNYRKYNCRRQKMTNVHMDLEPQEVDALLQLAKKERRRPKDQAAKIVADHLENEGVLSNTNNEKKDSG